MVFQWTQLQCEIKQATENLSEEKLLEYKDIFSFFDRWLQFNVPFKIILQFMLLGMEADLYHHWSLAK